MILLSTQRVGIYGNVEVNADFAQMIFFVVLLVELGPHISPLAAAS